ncbi:hypothetical protein ACLFMI_18805 [Pseudonocardia nantongensis]|uniref:hypothetical protein n=1 Tax=Pseudonocardia nantongensis TaxID=1181885 RepID=UPI00397BC5B2
MSTAARLCAYGAAVALLTAGAYLAGTTVPPPSWLGPAPAVAGHGIVDGGAGAGTGHSDHAPVGTP